MKKLVLLIVIVLNASFIFAQTNTNLLDTNKKWNALNYLIFVGNGGMFTTHSFTIGGDSIVGNYTYKKLMDLYYETSPTYPNPLQFYGLLREDTIAKKVYFINNREKNENLIYNFKLNKSDTFLLKCGLLRIDTFKVSSVDSILINNKKHKIINLIKNNLDTLNWIEGIGALQGLIYSYHNEIYNSFGKLLLCYWENDTLMYTNQKGYYCIYNNLWDAIKEFSKLNNSINISPNPAQDVITISGKLKVESFKVFDIAGKEVIWGRNNNTINISQLEKGIYFIRVVADDNKTYNSKFIKE